MENKKLSWKDGRVSLLVLNRIKAPLLVLLSTALLMTAYLTYGAYHNMLTTTENYVLWQQCAHELQSASDYLTDQARSFTMTGNASYLKNYFEEAKVTRRRDNALTVLEEQLAGTEADMHLADALQESMDLMYREYYAMRLVVEGSRYTVSNFPEEIQDVELSFHDANLLSTDEQKALGCSMLTDSVYRGKKEVINAETNLCLDSVIRETEQQKADLTNRLQLLLLAMRVFAVLLIAVIAGDWFLMYFLTVHPLLRSVDCVRNAEPIPIQGAKEYRGLAKMYNRMLELYVQRGNQMPYAAIHDRLTGAYNREGCEYLLSTLELDKCALLDFDIDHLKALNDIYGREMGNRILRLVVAKLDESFLSEAYVCRMGGDGFTVLLANTGPDLKEALRRNVERINELLGHPRDDLPPVSLSAGIAFGGEGTDSNELLKNADEAICSAKDQGDGRCVFYEKTEE